jgi:hypothetical protein
LRSLAVPESGNPATATKPSAATRSPAAAEIYPDIPGYVCSCGSVKVDSRCRLPTESTPAAAVKEP